MSYFRNTDSGRIYKIDQYGKNKLEIVNGERCVIPVCEIPAGVVRLDCADEDVWKFVQGGSRAGIHTREDKGWRQRLMAWRGR